MGANQQVQFTVALNWHECPTCGIGYGITPDFEQRRQNDGESFYCPRGHTASYHTSELDRVKKQLAAVEYDRDFQKEQRENERRAKEHAQASARTSRGHLTRVKKRIAAGVCPCCKRTFGDLARHMAGQHPTYATVYPELAAVPK